MSAEYEIDMSIPTASDVQDQEQEQEQEQELPSMTLEQLNAYLPSLSAPDLLDLLTTVNGLLKKQWKTQPADKKVAKRKASPQLFVNHAWLDFVKKHAAENGWEAFTISENVTDKSTKQKVVEETSRSGSKPNDMTPPYSYVDKDTKQVIVPAHIFEDTGKHLIHKEAMSLGKTWKWASGTKPEQTFKNKDEESALWSDLYREFMSTYEAPASSEQSSDSDSSSSSTPTTPVVRRLSAQEKEEERAEKKRIMEEEKESKRQAREEKKEQSRLKKEQEEREKEERRLAREAKKAEKEREAEEKKREKEEKEAEKEVSKKSPPAAAVKKAVVPVAKATASSASSSSATKVITPVPKATAAVTKTVTPVPKAPAAAAKTVAPKQLKPKMTFEIPDDDMVHPWTWEGVKYMARADKCVWKEVPDSDVPVWVGMVDLEKGIIDTTISEPEYEDE